MQVNLNYSKRRLSKKQMHNIRRRRLISVILITSILFFLSSSVIYRMYRKTKCRDLQYAIEYKLTSGNSSDRLLRVQHISLIYNDNDKAVVEVSGLSKSKPHGEATIRCIFKKDSFNSWSLESTDKS